MKKAITITAVVAAASVGGWAIYKHMHPSEAKCLERDLKRATKDAKSTIENMM